MSTSNYANIMFMDIKAIGYSLLATGLIIIALAGFNVYGILTGSVRAFSYFDFEPIKMSLVPGAPEIEVLDAKTLNETSNFLGQLFVLGFVVTIGAKISSLGVEMLRPIKVNVRKEKQDGEKIQAKQ